MDTSHVEQPTEPLSRLEVDLGAITANVAAVRNIVGDGPVICGVVKKNAYGLGAVTVAHRMAKAGCGMLAVYGPDEAEALTAGAVTTPLLVLYPLRRLTRTEGLYRPASAGRLHLTIHDPDQLDELDAVGRAFGIRLPVHLYLDTGMSRSGLDAAQFADALKRQTDRRYLRVAGVMSHLATAGGDPKRAAKQRDRFDDALAEHRDLIPKDALIHLANTYGLLREAAYHRAMVRPGLGLYGYGEDDLLGEPTVAPGHRWTPAVRWVSRVVQVGTYPRHAAVGYGATYKLTRKSTLGLVPVGYGDGYPLALSSNAERCAAVRVRVGDTWHDAAVLGRVNMDQLSVDLTDAAKATDTDAASLKGAEVEVYGRDPEAGNALPRLARLAGTTCYEMLTRLSPGLPRVYR
ncbi:MAG: alanine racemase [Planctomycetota bacterium]